MVVHHRDDFALAIDHDYVDRLFYVCASSAIPTQFSCGPFADPPRTAAISRL
jgi:hypothetical protein